MVLEREIVQERLKELDQILQELQKYRSIACETLQADLSQRWIVERGLIAAASVIFDITDHILAGHFGFYADTYEGSLEGLCENKIISGTLYDQIRGLGGFRNILIHRYVRIGPQEVASNFEKGLRVFPQFAAEILSWLDSLDTE
jgi:uncharacterized protein YutE (UPF0331/DUF86 family)